MQTGKVRSVSVVVLLLFAGGVLLPASSAKLFGKDDVIFFDDFEAYVTDDDLLGGGWEIFEVNKPSENAAWTVTNPGGRANPPIADGRPSQGVFLVSDSDAAGGDDHQGTGRSHDIWSPPFSCIDKSPVWIHMDCTAVLNNNGEVVFDVDVTDDSGESWTNVFRRVAPGRVARPMPLADIPEAMPGGPQVGNSDGFFGRLDIDISAVAAGKDEVRFRLRQFEPSDDWWIAVDDVQVDTTPVVEGKKVFLDESFESGIPDTWRVESQADGTAPWRAEDPCSISLLLFNGGKFPDGLEGRRIHHLDDIFALAAGDDACTFPLGDEMLSTPSLDLSETSRVFLHFKSDVLMTDTTAEVLLSLDGILFDTDHPIWSNQLGGGMYRGAGNAEVVYNKYIFEVPAAAGQKSVTFGFHWLNMVAQSSFWAIDEVRVTGEVPPPPGPGFVRGDCNHDGKADITDAVSNLTYQFLGGAIPDCLEACNVNGDGTNDLTDAISLLSFLFLGGPEPPAPGPHACGKDPEPGPLSCDASRC